MSCSGDERDECGSGCSEKVNFRKMEVRNFWNSCPRHLESLPTKPCEMGKIKRNAKGKMIQEPTCEWGIDHKESHYCFWRWMRSRSDSKGNMHPLYQNEISQLLGYSSTRIYFILKEISQKLRVNTAALALEELSQDMPERSVSDEPVPLSNFGIQEPDDDKDTY